MDQLVDINSCFTDEMTGIYRLNAYSDTVRVGINGYTGVRMAKTYSFACKETVNYGEHAFENIPQA